MSPPPRHSGDRGDVPGDEGRHEAGDPVAGQVEAPEPPEVGERQRERLIGQEVRPSPRLIRGTATNHGAIAAE